MYEELVSLLSDVDKSKWVKKGPHNKRYLSDCAEICSIFKNLSLS